MLKATALGPLKRVADRFFRRGKYVYEYYNFTDARYNKAATFLKPPEYIQKVLTLNFITHRKQYPSREASYLTI
jgi:hypothetical protein